MTLLQQRGLALLRLSPIYSGKEHASSYMPDCEDVCSIDWDCNDGNLTFLTPSISALQTSALQHDDQLARVKAATRLDAN
ncbi:MAG: hypothetical protein ACJ74W_22825 [Pyrinomonadaceae bacterium]